MARPRIVIGTIIVAFLMVAEMPALFATESWTIASETNFYPYNYWEKGQRTGLDAEIVEAVLKELGVVALERTMSWTEVVKAVQEGSCDMAYQFNDAWFERNSSTLIKVGPFRIGEPVLMSRADADIVIRSISDLAKYRVGIVQSYTYIKDFSEFPQIEKVVSISTPGNLRRLLLGRVDLVIGDRDSLTATAEREGKLARVKVLPTPLPKMPRYFAFPADRGDKAERFRVALEKLMQDGTIDKIRERWSKSVHP